MTLKQALDANTAARLANMDRTDYDAIDDGIAELIAAKTGNGAPDVGDEAPDFTLPDAIGQRVSLSAALSDRPVVVSFYRGGWCSYCNVQLRAYQDALTEIRAAGGDLIAITPEAPDHTVSTKERHDLAFPVLTDAKNDVARAYGLEFEVSDALRPLYRKLGIDLIARNGDDGFRLPVPATFVINQSRHVAWRFLNPDYTQRAEPQDIVNVLRSL